MFLKPALLSLVDCLAQNCHSFPNVAIFWHMTDSLCNWPN